MKQRTNVSNYLYCEVFCKGKSAHLAFMEGVPGVSACLQSEIKA